LTPSPTTSPPLAGWLLFCQQLAESGFTCLPCLQKNPVYQPRAWCLKGRPPFALNVTWWRRNVNLLSIDYAFRPRLRSG
jgi:hypothetical protein